MPPSSMQSLNEAPALTPPPRPVPPADSMNAEKKLIQLATVQERLHCLTPLHSRVCRGSHPAPTPPGTSATQRTGRLLHAGLVSFAVTGTLTKARISSALSSSNAW